MKIFYCSKNQSITIRMIGTVDVEIKHIFCKYFEKILNCTVKLDL